MALRSNTNFLNFTNLTYSEIIQQVANRLSEDPRFENFRESAIAQMVMEIFSATTDFTNYMLERRAEEQFFETLQLRSSAISLAKNIGYVITRPIPASTALSVTIKGPLPSGITVGDKLTLYKGTADSPINFQHKSDNYMLTKTYQYTFTSTDIINGTGSSSWSKTINVAVDNLSTVDLNSQGNVPTSAAEDISLIQGELKVQTFLGSAPDSSRGQTFQKYAISDTSFSNIYGEEDYSYDITDGTYNLSEGFTKIGIGIDESTALSTTSNLYEMARRSILTQDTTISAISNSINIPQVCLVDTKLNEGTSIEFGDGTISKIGPITINDNLYVRYLSTTGANANQVGVVGEKITTDGYFQLSDSGVNITNNLEFRLSKNITGGADLESIDSIKFNAPGIYQALDRVVTSKDYISFLKQQTSPINVKNAIAWGEQEEVERLTEDGQSVVAQKKLFNIVFYSVIGELYYFLDTDTSGPRISGSDTNVGLTDMYLEGDDYDSYSALTYFNLLVAGTASGCAGVGIVDQLGTIDSYIDTHPISVMTKKLDNKSQITIKNVYIPPLIQKFRLAGTVYVKNLYNLSSTKTKVNKKIYEFLNEDADFAKPVYISNITDEIKNQSEVLYSDVWLEAIQTSGAIIGTTIANDADVQACTAYGGNLSNVVTVINDNIKIFIDGDDLLDATAFTSATDAHYDVASGVSASDNFDIASLSDISLSGDTWGRTIVTDREAHYRMANFNSRRFFTYLMKDIWEGLSGEGTYRDSDEFKNVMVKLYNDITETIRNGMLDERGNIVNFSLSHEIAQIENNTIYRYKS